MKPKDVDVEFRMRALIPGARKTEAVGIQTLSKTTLDNREEIESGRRSLYLNTASLSYLDLLAQCRAVEETHNKRFHKNTVTISIDRDERWYEDEEPIEHRIIFVFPNGKMKVLISSFASASKYTCNHAFTWKMLVNPNSRFYDWSEQNIVSAQNEIRRDILSCMLNIDPDNITGHEILRIIKLLGSEHFVIQLKS